MKALKIALKTILIALGVLFVVVAAYLAYVIFSYSRIEDNLVLEPKEKTTEIASSDKTYTIVTQNIGFGAYTPSFTFFMDGGKPRFCVFSGSGHKFRSQLSRRSARNSG